MLKKLNKKNQKGFTLVELLVVIAIIGILAVVAVPSLFSQIEKSKAADITATIDIIKTASTAYYADQENAPSDIGTSLKEENTLMGKKYLDSDPNLDSKGKVSYDINAITDVEKSAQLDVIINKGYMTKSSINKLEKDLGAKITTEDENSKFTITLIDHVKAE